MIYRYPAWPRIYLAGGPEPDKAQSDWPQSTTLCETSPTLLPYVSDGAECSCLDRSLADFLDLLKALDAYDVEH